MRKGWESQVMVFSDRDAKERVSTYLETVVGKIVEFMGAGARRRAALPCFSPTNIELFIAMNSPGDSLLLSWVHSESLPGVHNEVRVEGKGKECAITTQKIKIWERFYVLFVSIHGNLAFPSTFRKLMTAGRVIVWVLQTLFCVFQHLIIAKVSQWSNMRVQ